ncbi:hypothetical protein E8E13_007423 [Curvularia kusanoi]|uniref:DUF7580 domain-containing protein n=1 Tax=Curvularia kusanoi TaxID=90978 RepID=A0A9P4TA64_CURKU|nr:hypothetical protein E8E13_007423 [Curvularia kusanoi]
MLQFNDTPWLRRQWRLTDLKYLGSSNSYSMAALKTMHLNSQISPTSDPNATEGQMDGIQHTDAVTDEVRQGVDNTTLFSLGIAMLEIAYWTPIEQKMTAMDENNCVLAARRLMCDRGAPLGPEYQRIAAKCLRCDFGFGPSLNSNGLQSAIYNDVVLQLDGMIKRLENLHV